jgi:hypothetical protein
VRVVDVAAFLRGGRRVRGRHAFTRRVLHWPYCQHCGMVLLKNEASRRAAGAVCVRIED